MTTNNDSLRNLDRGLQRDARAWQRFTGMKYTKALRLMQHPLAQGILGERISSRALIRVLTEHPVLVDSGVGAGATSDSTNLGENGIWSALDHPLEHGSEDSFLRLVMAAEVLRMFTPIGAPADTVSSYSLKHVAENYLGDYLGDFSYVTNGKLIWAAAALGLPLAEIDPGEYSPNVFVGVDPQQAEYSQGMAGQGPAPRAHHHRPPGYEYLRSALEVYAATGSGVAQWNGVDEAAEPLTSPFHEWLIAQVSADGRRDVLGTRENLAYDYGAGVDGSFHSIARNPEDLMFILSETSASPQSFEAARVAIIDWARTSPLSTGIRTEPINMDRHGHEGWGAGSGTVERYEYRCPCGKGTILEEHDNIPGFREHDVRILCDTCHGEWRFRDDLSVREWRIEPVPA